MAHLTTPTQGGCSIVKKRNARLDLYGEACLEMSKNVTHLYSTSFSKAIKGLGSDIRDAVYAIYGFVRLVDEVVDSFHGYDQRRMFDDLKNQTEQALASQFSTNPILHAFQKSYHAFGIEKSYVDAFMNSMERDLSQTEYDESGYAEYIKGSAEVVGLMCLKIFVRGDQAQFDRLKPAAIRLGAAFQKVNFLRDIREDFEQLGRTYFPGTTITEMNAVSKQQIELDIENDLAEAYKGIIQLPKDARFGVYLAYRYYRKLLLEIKKVPSSQLLKQRIRVADSRKALLWASSYARHQFNLV